MSTHNVQSMFWIKNTKEEHSGIVVEHQTLNREVLGWIPTGSTVFCPLASHINSLEFC